MTKVVIKIPENLLTNLDALRALYSYVGDDISEIDFFDMPEKGYEKLDAKDRHLRWYVLNPTKLKKSFIHEQAYYILNEKEKDALLSAFDLIKTLSRDLPENVTFLERLFYAKPSFASWVFD